MPRILLAGALAVLGVLTAAVEPASAQYYRYGYNPYTGRSYSAYGGYNAFTGGYRRGGAYYNPYTGGAGRATAGYNAFTGRQYTHRSYYNPMTGRGASASAYRNPFTGRYGYHYRYRR
jgi:hypothetical protein